MTLRTRKSVTTEFVIFAIVAAVSASWMWRDMVGFIGWWFCTALYASFLHKDADKIFD